MEPLPNQDTPLEQLELQETTGGRKRRKTKTTKTKTRKTKTRKTKTKKTRRKGKKSKKKITKAGINKRIKISLDNPIISFQARSLRHRTRTDPIFTGSNLTFRRK